MVFKWHWWLFSKLLIPTFCYIRFILFSILLSHNYFCKHLNLSSILIFKWRIINVESLLNNIHEIWCICTVNARSFTHEQYCFSIWDFLNRCSACKIQNGSLKTCLVVFSLSNIHDNEYIVIHFRSNVIFYTDSKGQ